MTGTVVDALQDATTELHNAATLLQGLAVQVQQNLANTTASATTIINNFLGRPPVVTVYVDPQNGNDANDGSSPAQAKKSLDLVLDNMGTSATTVYLLGDTTLIRRRNIYAALTILGVQPVANGVTYIQRTISFLGTAQNSPAPLAGTFSSGLWFLGSTFSTNHINWDLPDQVAGQTYPSHLYSDFGTNFFLSSANLQVDTANAAALIGSKTNTVHAFLDIALGINAPGHLFDGVAAGSNPNSKFQYSSNITSA